MEIKTGVVAEPIGAEPIELQPYLVPPYLVDLLFGTRPSNVSLETLETLQNLDAKETALWQEILAEAATTHVVPFPEKKVQMAGEERKAILKPTRYLDPRFLELFNIRSTSDTIEIPKKICDQLFDIAVLRDKRKRVLGFRHAKTRGYADADAYNHLLCAPSFNVLNEQKRRELVKKAKKKAEQRRQRAEQEI